MYIDSHCHTALDWYEPIESLLYQMDNNNVEKAVLIQMLGQFDNHYLQACVKKYPERFVSVVGVDVNQADACDQLEALVEQGAKGLRLRPTAPLASATKKRDDPLALWRKAEALGIPISCVGNTTTFNSPEFIQIIELHPRLVIVLEHLGGTSTPDQAIACVQARMKIHELARYPNVYIKMTGLGELIPRGQFSQKPQSLINAFKTFGAERMMWGSDYPPVSSREGYRNALNAPQNFFKTYDEQAIDALFYKTANKVFFSS